MPNTSRWNLPYPASTDPPAGHTEIQALANALDGVAMDDQGTLANRPVSTSGNPGKKGRYYMVNGDSTSANNGILWRDNGTGWDQVGSSTIVDTRANRPTATAVPAGTRFFASDQVAEWISTGTVWIRTGDQVGHSGFSLAATPSAGHIFLQGQAWPATTGIYADLFGILGGSTLPDMRQRVPAGFKTADADMGTLLATGGEKTHTLSLTEIPSHAHRPGRWAEGYQFRESIGGGTGDPNEVGSGPSDVVSAVRESATEAVGGGGAHNNLQPFIVVNFEAKL